MKAVIPLVILAALTLACNYPAPTPDATLQAEVRELRDDVYSRAEGRRLAAEVRELRDDVSALQEPPTQEPMSLAMANSAERPDICNRFPALQYAILNNLNLGQCGLATHPELFRVERLSLEGRPIATPLQAKDFAGLVNLTELSINFIDACGQWDDLAFTNAVVAELPSLASFQLNIYRPDLERKASTAEEIANAVFRAIHSGPEGEATSRDTESYEDYMYARITGEAGEVRVEIRQQEDMPPCRGAASR